MKKRFFLLLMALLILLPSSALFAQAKPKYTFYHLLWSLTDPNVKWHTAGGEEYMKTNPQVQIKYVGPENYDPAEHAKFLDTIIKANPDGILLHISSVDALLPGLREAKRRGIPIVSVTSHPPGAEDEAKLKGLYLTWVGADEGLIGMRLGERAQQSVKPVHVAYLMGHLGHAGHEARAKGFFQSMPAGVKTDRVAIGDEPSHAKDVIRSYLKANPDVNIMFGMLLSNKWVWDVAQEMKRNIALLTSDEAPTSLEAVVQGKYLATFSQEFPIQANLAYHVLYLYKETGMAPVSPIITGPMVIDKSNAQMVKDLALKSLGEKEYYKLSPW
jgi:simple sugar transport system substrate-binding protein